MKYTAILAILVLCLGLAGCRSTPQERAAHFMQSGDRHFAQKDYARAVLQYRNAVQATPKSAEAYYRLGSAFIAGGNLRSGIANLKKATELDPKHARAQAKLAELMAETNSKALLEEARKRSEMALSVSPDDPEALSSLAMAEFRLGNSKEAEQLLRDALQKSPTDERASAGLAGLALAKGDDKKAEQLLKDAASRQPRSADARVVLGEFYYRVNRLAEAEQQFRAAAQIDPQNPTPLLLLAGLQARAGRKADAEKTLAQLSTLPDPKYKAVHAIYLYDEGKKEAALAELEDLAHKNPEDRLIRSRLVSTLFDAGKSGEAEKILNSALKKNSKDTEALLQRAEIAVRQDRFSAAESDLNQLQRYRPESGQIHYLLARVNLARGASLQARQEFNRALQLAPTLLAARLQLAAQLIQENSARAALDVLKEAPETQRDRIAFIVQRNWALWAAQDRAGFAKGVEEGLRTARNPDLLLQDAILKTEAQDFRGAENSLLLASRLAPNDLRVADAIARFHWQRNQRLQLVNDLAAFAQAHPKSAEAQALLAQWLVRTGDSKRAREAFEAAKAADPRFTSADLALAQLDISDGNFAAARQRLSAMAQLKTENLRKQADVTSARVLLANLDEMSGDHTAAIAGYRRVLESNPTNAMALNNLSYLLITYAHQPDEGLQYAQKAKEADPNNPDIADTIGWAFYQKGLYQMALENLESTGAKASSALHEYHLAMAYLKLGDRAKGARVLGQALRLNPNLPEAAAARQLLK